MLVAGPWNFQEPTGTTSLCLVIQGVRDAMPQALGGPAIVLLLIDESQRRQKAVQSPGNRLHS